MMRSSTRQWVSCADFQTSRLFRGCIVAAVVAVAAACIAISTYRPLPVDGGWYSYAGYAISLGRGGFDHQRSVDFVLSGQGLRAAFPYDTASSPRALYAAGWFNAIGAGLLSIRLLTLVEYLLLLSAAWLLYRSFFHERWIAVIALLLLMTDKSIVFGAGADFRPDLALAAAATFLYFLLRLWPVNSGTALLVVVVGAIAASIHSTAPIPLSFVLVAAFVEAALSNAEDRKRRLVLVSAVGAWCMVCFFAIPRIIESLLGGPVGAENAVDVPTRILESWEGGIVGMMSKELSRWSSHFLLTNLPQLVGFMSAVGIGFLSKHNVLVARRLIGPAAGLAAAVLFTLAFDPHTTESHILPLVPFLPLAFVAFEVSWRKHGHYFLAGTVLISAAATFAIALRVAVISEDAGLSNRKMTNELAALTSDARMTLVAGGTEFWPYFPTGSNVVLLDRTRRPEDFLRLHGIPISSVDLIVAGEDHLGFGWEDVVAKLRDEGRAEVLLSVPERVLVARVNAPL